jgi:hypothetical protein
MITELPAAIKMSCVVFGSGLLVFADGLGDVSEIGQIGGWSLAVVGLVTFWRQAQKDRAKFDRDSKSERIAFITSLHEEQDERKELYAEQIRQSESWKEAINRLTHCIEEMIKEHKKA